MTPKKPHRTPIARPEDDLSLISLAMRMEADRLRQTASLLPAELAVHLLRLADELSRKHLPESLRPRLAQEVRKSLAKRRRPVSDIVRASEAKSDHD